LPSFINGRRQTALSRGHRHKQHGLGGIQHQPVGADAGVDQAVEPPIRRKPVDPPVDPPGGIAQPGLALVGKIDVAIAGDMQIVAVLWRKRHK
jgi:hypothetical protein